MRYLLKKLRMIFARTKYPTIKYASSFLLLLITFVGIAAVIGKDASYIRIAIPSTSIDAGSVFSIDIYAYAASPVNAVDISIHFPSDSIQIMGIDKGESVLTLWTEDPRVENDTVIMRGGTYRKGFIGDHKIATINAKALSTGKADFLVKNATLLAGDGKGTPLTVSKESPITSIYIYAKGEDKGQLEGTAMLVLITDLDNDGKVTLKDISAFMSSWYGSGPRHDFNNDGRMTFRDFSIILAAYFSG